MKRNGSTNFTNRVKLEAFEHSARHSDKQLWKAVFRESLKSSRRRLEVNLSHIDSRIKEHKFAVVPGKVLGGGSLSRNITIAANSFSRSATQKIRASGGRALSLSELLKEEPKPSEVVILK